MKLKRFFAVILISSLFYGVWCQADSKIKIQAFDIARYELTGKCMFSNTPSLCILPDVVPKMMMRVHWTLETGPSTLYGDLFPEYKGLMEASFCSKNDTDYTFSIEKFLSGFKFEKSSPSGEEADFIEEKPAENNGKNSENQKDSEQKSGSKNEKFSDDGNLINSETLEGTENHENPENQSDEELLKTISAVSKSIENSSSIVDEKGMLSLYTFEDEFLQTGKKSGEDYIVNSDGKTASRNFYDGRQRLYHKEIWKIGDINSASKIKDLMFYYDGDTTVLKSCVLSENNQKKEQFYDQTGKLSDEKNYLRRSEIYKNITGKTLEKPDEKKWLSFYPESEISYLWNEDGKLKEKSTVSYEYTEEVSELDRKTNRRTEKYNYKIEKCPPDYMLYENGKLKAKKNYLSASDYISTMYFDDSFSIESYYENGKHTKDIFYLNGLLLRQKKYE